jgi:hypothetical protein
MRGELFGLSGAATGVGDGSGVAVGCASIITSTADSASSSSKGGAARKHPVMKNTTRLTQSNARLALCSLSTLKNLSDIASENVLADLSGALQFDFFCKFLAFSMDSVAEKKLHCQPNCQLSVGQLPIKRTEKESGKVEFLDVCNAF